MTVLNVTLSGSLLDIVILLGSALLGAISIVNWIDRRHPRTRTIIWGAITAVTVAGFIADPGWASFWPVVVMGLILNDCVLEWQEPQP